MLNVCRQSKAALGGLIAGMLLLAGLPLWVAIAIGLLIGVSAGACLAGVIGDPSARLEHILAGRPLDRMAEAEHRAKPGEIVVDKEIPWFPGARLDLEPRDDGFGRLAHLENAPGPPSPVGLAIVNDV